MELTVTPIYSVLIVFLYLGLCARVIAYRRSHLVSLGDNDDAVLRTRIRAQGNCAEYAPLGLVLLLIAELQGSSLLVLNVLGVMLLAGRVLHAMAFGDTRMNLNFRAPGMVLTLSMIGLSALVALF